MPIKKRCNAQKKKTISDRSRSRFNSHRQNKKQNKKNGPNHFDIPGGGKQKKWKSIRSIGAQPEPVCFAADDGIISSVITCLYIVGFGLPLPATGHQRSSAHSRTFSHSSRNCRLWLTIEGPCMKRRPYGKKCTASLAGCHAETFLFGRFHKRSPALVQSAPLEWTKHPISHAFVYWPSHAKAMRKKQMISSERKKRFRCVPRKSDARAEHNRRSRGSQKWFYLFFVGPAWVSF